MYVIGNARDIVQARVDAQGDGEHLRLRKIAGAEVDLLVESTFLFASGSAAITVWFGDEMVELTMDEDVRLEWERSA